MKLSLIEQKNEYEARKRKRKFWRSIVTALSCVVVFCTTYALILPAITLENTAYCGYEEHTHSEECYQMLLTCEETDKEISSQNFSKGIYIVRENNQTKKVLLGE